MIDNNEIVSRLDSIEIVLHEILAFSRKESGENPTGKELKALHQSGRKKEIINSVLQKHGECCACCGSTERINYHHIVPLYVGGTNRPSNIVPLCVQCHHLAHYGTRLDKTKLKKVGGGRKRKEPTHDAIQAFKDYVDCKIPRSEAEKIMDRKADWTKVWWQRKIVEEKNIVEFHNNIGVKLALTGSLRKGEPTGWIKTRQGDGRIVMTQMVAHRNFTAKEFDIETKDRRPYMNQLTVP